MSRRPPAARPPGGRGRLRIVLRNQRVHVGYVAHPTRPWVVTPQAVLPAEWLGGEGYWCGQGGGGGFREPGVAGVGGCATIYATRLEASEAALVAVRRLLAELRDAEAELLDRLVELGA